MEKFQSSHCSASIHSAVSYCVVGETKRTAIDFGTSSIDIERENICIEPEKYLTRLKLTNISGNILKLMAAYPIITDDMSIGNMSSSSWGVYNGARQMNDVPATCVLGLEDASLTEAFERLSEEGMQKRMPGDGDIVLYGDGITVIKAGKHYVSLEVLTNDHQLTDISISSDCNGNVKAIRIGGEFNCLMENGDVLYTDWVRICSGGNFIRLIDNYASDRRAMNNVSANKYKNLIYMTDDDFSGDAISDKLSFLKGLKAPFDYIEIGQGWQTSIGDWEAAYGINLNYIAGKINKSGYKAGIWTAPFIVERNSEFFENYKSWILRHADGSVCTYNIGEKTYAVLDISNEECLNHVIMIYKNLCAMGFYMHHIDHTNAFIIQKDTILLDPTLSNVMAYKRAMKAISDVIGEEGYMCVTNGFNPPITGVADCVQISSHPEDMRRKTDSNALMRLANQVSFRGYMSKFYHTMCASVITSEFLSSYSPHEIRRLLMCEYISGGVSTVSDLKTNDELKILKYLYPPVEISVYPRDAYEENAYINVVDIEVGGDYHTLCFFNNSFVTKELIFRLDNKTCGGYVDHASLYNISTYFSREKLLDCAYDNIIKLGTIPANSCEIVKIAKSNVPQILLSDMHFSMGGEVEITDFNDRIRVCGNNYFNCKGSYVVALPAGKKLSDGKREFSFTVNGEGPFVYEKQI